MQLTKLFRNVLIPLLLGVFSILNTVQSQSLDEDTSIKLSEQEIARLRAVLDQPVDPSALKATRVQDL